MAKPSCRRLWMRTAMSIDLRKVIGDDSAIKSGGFTGAVFLTYTLNLAFYEQMIAPMLDQAGCANVLILADPDGYSGALEMGAKTISGAGLRYVCAPVVRTGGGIQHAKLLLMVGPKRGRLLIGSGNLTLHGFGRNLELFSHFECNPINGRPEELYAFTEAWRLIQKIAAENELPLAARNQIKALNESATWLMTLPPKPTDFRLWYNFDRSLLDQLNAWRAEHGWSGLPVQEIRVISPYFDRDTEALQRMAGNFSPNQIHVHLDPALTNLDGRQAALDWSRRQTPLMVMGIGPGEETSTLRHVHAKAIIGRDVEGAWCITGSANLTRPALLRSWRNGGNLELVTFRWSPDPHAFDAILHDPTVKVWPLNLADVNITEVEPSERPAHVEAPFMLSDLSARGTILEGRLSSPPVVQSENLYLRLLRKNLLLPVRLEAGLAFHILLPVPLAGADAARVEVGDLATPYRWIDQPDTLARFGARTYQVRVKGKLETILGAEQLFQELMNYLWERVDTHTDADDQDPRVLRGCRRFVHGNQPDVQDGPPPPAPEDFITDEELVRTLHWGIESHQPYDRSLLSLRDLLSLVLLRLTTTTQSETADLDTARDEDIEQQRQAEQEAQQIKVVERLRNYLLGYCKRYGRRLSDSRFVNQKSPEIIFQNHYTLSRVLLEFASKTEITFTRGDLYRCFWWVWGPLIWPEVVGMDGQATLDLLQLEYPGDQISQAWNQSGLPGMSVAIMCESLGQPPSWRAGLWDKKRVATFMIAREWIARIRLNLGENAFQIQAQDTNGIFGIRSATELIAPVTMSEEMSTQLQASFVRIANYLPPAEDKYAFLIRLQALEKDGKQGSTEGQSLVEQIYQQDLSKEYADYCRKPAPILPSDDAYCPRCGGKLTVQAENELEHGQLVLCPKFKDAWIYYQPKLPRSLSDVS